MGIQTKVLLLDQMAIPETAPLHRLGEIERTLSFCFPHSAQKSGNKHVFTSE
ncbi:MAG: hypothetical protein ACI9SC_001946 [Gammaproteobacteria bacterium]|jgi:hypothetical protein